MWKIKDIEIKSRVVLAPMAGITSIAYREFCKPFGVGLSYTEMVSDCGLVFGNERTFDYVNSSKVDRPLGIQLFGNDYKTMVEAIKIIEEKADYDILDINLGCPVKKVAGAGSGSSWLKPERLDDLRIYIREIVKASSKPVTAKIRLGWDDKSINVNEVVDLLIKEGVSAIGIHARTAKQLYSGKPNFEAIRDLGRKISVPLMVSGDIYTLEDAINAIEITGASAVMVARGGVGNPNLIKQIDHYYKTGEKLSSSPLNEKIEQMKTYVDMLIEEKGEERAMMIARGILPKFLVGFPNTKKVRVALSTQMKTKNDFLEIIKDIEG